MSFNDRLRDQLRQKEIWYVRHGEGEHNVKINGLRQNMGVFGDPHLTELGRSQARACGAVLDSISPELIVHSAMNRTRETVNEILTQLSHEPRVVSYATIHEINTGENEGKLTPGGMKMLKDLPGAETPSHLASRVMQALEFIARQPEKRVVIVAHSRIGRMFTHLAEYGSDSLDEFDKEHVAFPHDRPIQLHF